jgi:hypothetical protein
MKNDLKISRLRWTAAAAFAAWSCQASAEVDARDFLRMVEEHRWSARTYLMGVMIGLEAANDQARKQFGARLYCMPETITPDRQIELILNDLNQLPDEADLPVSRVVTNTLVRHYPCPS